MYRIEEFPEVWVDACLRSSEGRLMFLSAYGRDGSLMQLMAALDLGGAERGGADRFHLVNSQGARHPVDVNGTSRLNKHTGRLPKQNLFGPLSHMWLFDKTLQQEDKANRIAWVLQHAEVPAVEPSLAPGNSLPALNHGVMSDRVWQTLVRLSPVALMEHWREPVMQWCLDKGAIDALNDPVYPALGPVSAIRVSLSDHYLTIISDSVRSGLLRA